MSGERDAFVRGLPGLIGRYGGYRDLLGFALPHPPSGIQPFE